MRCGEIETDADDLPSFLYPENGYVEGHPEENLFKSPILIVNFICFFKGPSAASPSARTDNTKGGGRPPLYKIYNLDEVRFGYTSKNTWQEDDGPFIGAIFYENILSLFKDDATWATKTLSWYNREVYGNGSQEISPSGAPIRKRVGPSPIELIRQNCAAATVVPATPTTPIIPIDPVLLDISGIWPSQQSIDENVLLQSGSLDDDEGNGSGDD
ncbi:hypothetical protein WOLCODRAFT_154307 [Wolfiporia cocos MD-104 SS10]|uniref:Uncharacterized protein n=1 Tax=Wolfiporia cocos (strain MD-104) TaxID=742152 RepID=A0A2H3JQ31_WOLCO|nr:hypothetical protein WOLCODRAFT_154307 [Wolfiporia cocos MD-104 SS10]